MTSRVVSGGNLEYRVHIIDRDNICTSRCFESRIGSQRTSLRSLRLQGLDFVTYDA